MSMINEIGNQTAAPRPLLDKAGVAAWLRISTRQVDRLCKTDDFPKGFRVGKVLRWKPEAIEEYLHKQEQSA